MVDDEEEIQIALAFAEEAMVSASSENYEDAASKYKDAVIILRRVLRRDNIPEESTRFIALYVKNYAAQYKHYEKLALEKKEAELKARFDNLLKADNATSNIVPPTQSFDRERKKLERDFRRRVAHESESEEQLNRRMRMLKQDSQFLKPSDMATDDLDDSQQDRIAKRLRAFMKEERGANLNADDGAKPVTKKEVEATPFINDELSSVLQQVEDTVGKLFYYPESDDDDVAQLMEQAQESVRLDKLEAAHNGGGRSSKKLPPPNFDIDEESDDSEEDSDTDSDSGRGRKGRQRRKKR